MTAMTQRLGALLLAGLVAGTGGTDAFAQRRKREPKPAEAPAAPATPAPQQNNLKIDLQPSQANWTKVCGKDQASGREVCYTTRDFGQGPEQAPVLALAVYDIKGNDKRIMRLLLPVALLLRPGFRFNVDQGTPGAGAFAICFPNGCFAEAEVTPQMLSGMKNGTTMFVSVRNQAGGEVDFSLPLAGFGKAFDGPPIDPKVLAAQQKEIQHQLEERAKREREKLKGAAPAPAPAPAPK